jgi:hypothetical protein
MNDAARNAFRMGFAPLMSERSLEVLRAALESDDPRLIQGATTLPVPLFGRDRNPVEQTDAIAFCLWQAEGMDTTEELYEAFHQLVWDAGCALGEPTEARHYLVAWDDLPREEAIAATLEMVNEILSERRQLVAA